MKRRPDSTTAGTEPPPAWMRRYEGQHGPWPGGWRIWQQECSEWADAHGWTRKQLLGLWHPHWIPYGWAEAPPGVAQPPKPLSSLSRPEENHMSKDPKSDQAAKRLAQLRAGRPGPLEQIARDLISGRPDLAADLGLPGVIADLDRSRTRKARP